MMAGTTGLELIDEIMEARNFTNMFNKGKAIQSDRNARNQGVDVDEHRDGSATLGGWWSQEARNQGSASSSITPSQSIVARHMTSMVHDIHQN